MLGLAVSFNDDFVITQHILKSCLPRHCGHYYFEAHIACLFLFFCSADGLLHFFSVILTVPLVQHLLNFGMLNVAMLDSYQQQWHISLHDYSVISCTV